MSYNCIDYNCDSLGDHELISCGNYLGGGIADVILLECDHEITDPSNGTEINDAISAGKAHLVENVKYSLDPASANSVASPVANTPDTVTRYDRTGTFYDANVNATNVSLYNVLCGNKSLGGVILRLRDEGKVFWINEAVRFQGGLTIPDSNGDWTRFEGNFTYRTEPDAGSPNIYEEPTGVFTA